jgi:hypothetical protein
MRFQSGLEKLKLLQRSNGNGVDDMAISNNYSVVELGG